MVYNDFQDLRLSALGFGAMRLPTLGGDDARIDEEQTARMVDYAIEHGVNYFDTAYGYHAGNSERVMGKLLGSYARSDYMLASKFPGYDLSNMDKVQSIFEEQLERCGVEYFDFYLFHNVYEKNIGPYLDEKYGIMDYLRRRRDAGRIKHLGFSAHGDCEVLERFLDAYGSEMEFCQIQLNYLDWNFQNAEAKVELLNARNIPVWVMEPLRGGRLAALSAEDTARLGALNDWSAAQWALNFVRSVPGVTLTLSGMSDMNQLVENIEIFEKESPLAPTEFETLLDVARDMLGREVLPCTACRYCTTHCPMELDVPSLLSLYNEFCFTKGGFIAPMAVDALPQQKKPSACIGCRSCEAVCPQQLKISEALSDFSQKLGL